MQSQPRNLVPTVSGAAGQRGAAAVFVAVAIIALLSSAAFVVNIGQLYYAKRDLENHATLAALAGAQVASGCRANGIPGTQSQVNAAVAQSLTNNVIPGGGLLTAITLNGDAQLGYIDDITGYHVFKQPATNMNPTNAVRVTLTRPIPTPLISLGGLFSAPGTLSATATAEQPGLGAFYLGTGVASLNGGILNSLLQGLLCPNGSAKCLAGVSLVVANYAGLANAQVSLGQLGTAVGVNSKDLSSLLTTSTTLPGVLGGLSGVVDGTSTVSSQTIATILQDLAAGGNTNSFPLNTLLSGVNQAAAAVPFVDLQDLILALGAAANAAPNGQVNPIALQNLPALSVAGTTVTVFASVGAPPQFSGNVPAVGSNGPAQVHTAEITLSIRIAAGGLLTTLSTAVNNTVNTTLKLLSVLSLGFVKSSVVILPTLNFGVDVAVAPAQARLDTLLCPTTTNPLPATALSAGSSIASVKVGSFTGSAATSPPPLDTGTTSWQLVDVKIDATAIPLLPLGQGEVKVNLNLSSVDVGGGSASLQSLPQSVTQFIQHGSYASCADGSPTNLFCANGGPSAPLATNGDNPQTVGSAPNLAINLALGAPQYSGSGLTGVLTGLLTAVVNTVTTTLTPLVNLVNGLATTLINPLLNALGIQLGTATVIMDSVQTGQPMLVSTVPPPAPGP